MKLEPVNQAASALPAASSVRGAGKTGAQEGHTILAGRSLMIARVGWLTGVVLYIGLFVLGIPSAYARARILSPETQAAFAEFGLPSNFPALYWLTLDSLTMFGFATIALFIVARRPNDWLVMLTSLTLLGTAALYTDPPTETALPLALVALAFALVEIFQVSFVYLFPNGRFIPRWLGVLLIPMFIWRPAIWALTYLPNYYATVRTGENYGTLRQDALDTGLMVVLFVIGIVAQVYRYRKASTPTQKLQTKWLVFGIVGAIVVAGSYVILVNALGLFGQGGLDALVSRMIGRTVRQIALFLLPVTLAFSILRYRLWDIDILIRRSLIYVPLTAILAGLFAAFVTVLQRVFIAMTGQQSLIATILATLVVVAAIEPIEKTIKRVVEQRYKDAPTAHEVLKSFGERVQTRLSLVEPLQILRRFCDEAVKAFEAVGGATFLDKEGRLTLVGTHGAWNDDARIQVEVCANGTRFGAIALGARPFDRAYSHADRAALEKVAAIVGNAIEQDDGNG